MKRRVYISGPITGMPNDNREAFKEAARVLEDLGYDPVNPFDVGVNVTPGQPTTWADCLRADLRALLDCQGVALLPGHDKSQGSNLEAYVARSLGMEVMLLEDWERVLF
jgi:hypothetical protein